MGAQPPMEISVGSTQYVRVPVAATISGAAHNPTGDTVKMAFLPAGVTPAGADLKTAVWETDPTTTPPTYAAMCLVGPAGTVTLPAGLYQVWVQVTDSPEVPLLRCRTALRVV